MQTIMLQDSNWEYVKFRGNVGMDRTSLLSVLGTVFDFFFWFLYVYK